MDKGDSSGGIPRGGLVAIALLAAGAFFVVSKPLHTGRPVQAQQVGERRDGLQDVDARLWQDPLAAVAAAQAADARSADDPSRHGPAPLRLHLAADPAVDTVVLAVMILGGPYAEQVEGRLRLRYAVLAGLAGRGFVPSDNEHLGYFRFQAPGPAPADSASASAAAAGPADIVPFERFRCGNEHCTNRRIVVLWLDSGAYVDAPLHKLAQLAAAVTPPRPPGAAPIRWRVLGPPTSDGLRSFAQEAAGPFFDPAEPLPFDMRFFSGAATVPDDTVLEGLPGRDRLSVTEWLNTRHVPLLRTIGTDDDLGRALIHELELRGLCSRDPASQSAPCARMAGNPTRAAADTAHAADPADPADRADQPARRPAPVSIAVVAEWDTLYGRKLQQQFRYDENTHAGFRLERWTYMRGLDGRLPGDTAPSEADPAKKSPGSEGFDAIGGDNAYIERPEGRSQFDYLRRLATRIRERDAALRRANPEGGIRAVGVLGNDVYDKLLVLQALQSELPNALFFTTDLDARLLLPSEQAWARNLIVASNFGLRLDDSLQAGFPPFRDSYQTSAYLSTLLALDNDSLAAKGAPDVVAQSRKVARWFRAPRVFEVSRSGFFDFSAAGPSVPAGPAGPADCKRWKPLSTCRDIHPPPSPMAPDVAPAAVFLAAAPLTLALWLPALLISRRARRALRRFVARAGHSPPRRRGRFLALVAGAAATVFVPALLVAWHWSDFIVPKITADGKPLSLTQGISPWPTYAIRLIVLVLCLYMTAWAWAALARNVHQISRDFRLGATRRHFNELLSAERGQMGPAQRIGSMLSVRFFRDRPALLGSRSGMSRAAVDFWKHYIVQNRAVARFVRTLVCMLVMFLFFVLVGQAFGIDPEPTQRGTLTVGMQKASTFPAVLAIQFLIFFVADATLLSVLFIRGLRLHNANWPERTLESFRRLTGVPVQYLDEWIDLQFIARRSRVVGALIYFPFIALSLMLLARSPFFDHWSSSPALYVIAGISFSIVLACAIGLRMSAEASRRHAVESMRDASLLARGHGDAALCSQLDALRQRMEGLSEGAFAPYSHQPLLRAILLPLLTVGGSSLFDYLSLLNV